MMKHLAFLFMFLGAVQAQEYKAVFDCSSDDARFILSRINLVEITMMMIESKGEKADFALTLHGGCVPMASQEYAEVVDEKDLAYIKNAQETLIRLSQRKNIKIIACAMSLESNALDKEEVLPFVKISENSFIDTIAYQNRGYAIMTFK